MDLTEIFIILTLPISLPMALLIQETPLKRYGKKLPYRPRFINWLWAAWGSYFWKKCPICHKGFGGHEPNGDLMSTWYSGEMVCRKCADLAYQTNQKNMELWKPQMSAYYYECLRNREDTNG